MRIRLRAKDITTLPDIALIRHSISQPVPGVSAHTWELTDLGVQRCAALADALRPYALSRLATSDEPKAVTTAETLQTHLNIAAPLIIEPAFRETRRESAAYFDNLGLFRSAIREAMKDAEHVIFGEEAFNAARVRFTTALDALIAAHPGESLGVVTHGTIMAMVLTHWTGVDAYSTWAALEMPAFAVVSGPGRHLVEFKPALDVP